ncbi:hypothetical protein [Yinghuangia seranimata]|uniref:hypothetical protein n=1 Tax=Yinghuangia seranimata TaxID=408067 RepID=UPI00248C214D|nr:hypothetical protein [Yinghuangia seranimata]MDI2128822.1 hypothetical protein [Yinghuangia seranimata]
MTESRWLQELALYVPPPVEPWLGPASWDDLYQALGSTLPRDYVDLMTLYGAGHWGNWLRMYTPLRLDGQGLVEQWRQRQLAFEAYPGLGGVQAVWPEPGGDLPFASTSDGDRLVWQCIGDPNDWPLLMRPRHAPTGPPLGASLPEVLLLWLRGDLEVSGFAGLDEDEDPAEFATFEPWPPGSHYY